MTAMPRDTDIANRLMLALGAIIIRFGEFELEIRNAIIAIHHGADRRENGEGPDEKLLPSDVFTQGTKYLRSSVKFDGMKPFAADIERVADTAERLAKKRNYIVHGFVKEFVEATQTVIFRKFNVDRKGGIYVGTDLPIALAELEKLRDEATVMTEEMSSLAGQLQHAFIDDDRSERILDFP
jgi:hypothetical protein